MKIFKLNNRTAYWYMSHGGTNNPGTASNFPFLTQMALIFDANFTKYAAGQEVFFSNFLYNHFLPKAIEHNTVLDRWSVREGETS